MKHYTLFSTQNIPRLILLVNNLSDLELLSLIRLANGSWAMTVVGDTTNLDAIIEDEK